MSWQSLTTRGGNTPQSAFSSSAQGGQIARNFGGGRKFRSGRLGRGRKAVYQLARRVNNLSKTLALDQDVHAIDQNFSNAVISTGTIQPILNVAIGDDWFNRDGNAIKIKSLYIRLAMNVATSATANQIVRFILFVDKSSNGALPAVTDVLSAANVNAPLNYLNKGRFYILRDRTYALAIASQDIIVDKIYKRFKPDLEATYIGTTAATASLGTNQLMVLMISDQVATGPTLAWYSRTKFLP